MIREITKRLFDLTQLLAERELETDPKAHYQRELPSMSQLAQDIESDESDNEQLSLAIKQIQSKSYVKNEPSSSLPQKVKSNEKIMRKVTYRDCIKPLGDNDDHLDDSQSDDDTKLSSAVVAVVDTEPLERDELPYLKDPATKVSMWSMFKDNIGKDMTKIQVPVYLNDPTSQL